jgi:hypothetical protein
LFTPLQEFVEQGLAIGLGLWHAGSDAIQEGPEIATDILLSRYRRAMETFEHLLGDDVPGPTRNRGAQIDVTPLGMTGRDQELVPVGEEPLDEAFDAAVSVLPLGQLNTARTAGTAMVSTFCPSAMSDG